MWVVRKRLRQLTLFIKRIKALKRIRRALFERSHLSTYLPIMREQLPHKIKRIYGDASCLGGEEVAQGQHPSHKKVKRGQMISDFFFRSKECLYPLMFPLLIWYAMVCFAVVSTYFTTTTAIVYGSAAWVDISTHPLPVLINVFCLVVFLGDMVVQLSAGFLSRGMVVVERERAVRRYMRSFLMVDCLLVVILLVALTSGQLLLNIPKMIILLKFARIFEIDRLYMRRLATTAAPRAIYVIAKQLVTIFNIAHTLGILFYAVDQALTQRPSCQQNPSLCWLNSSTAYSPILSYGWQLRYFYSLYWGINTICMISYGDIAPNNPEQTVFALLCFCGSFLTYGYVVNSIVKVILDTRNSRDNFRAELILYTTYMDNLALSKNHQYDFREYLESQFFEERARRHALQEEMKGRLPVQLRQELYKSAYHKMYEGLQIVLSSSPSLVQLLYLLQERKFTRGETILAQGAPLSQLLYLQKGQLKLSCARYQRTHQIITLCTPDEFVGLHELILNERAAFTVCTAFTSTVYFMSRQAMEEDLLRFTDLRQNWQLVKDELKFDCNYERIFYRCYFCGHSHHWYRCPDIFPSFANVSLAKKKEEPLPKRIPCTRFTAWKERHRLKGLRTWSATSQDRLLQKLQERIHELKAVKEAWRRNFEVDVHYDWQYYKPKHNLSRFKEEWNSRRQEKKEIQKIELPPVEQDQVSMGGLFSRRGMF